MSATITSQRLALSISIRISSVGDVGQNFNRWVNSLDAQLGMQESIGTVRFQQRAGDGPQVELERPLTLAAGKEVLALSSNVGAARTASDEPCCDKQIYPILLEVYRLSVSVNRR
jgi:hypothetical protein